MHIDDHPRHGLHPCSLGAVLAALALAIPPVGAWLAWDYLPGTIRLSKNGFPRGTGTLRYYYPSGSLKVEDAYRNGLQIRSTCYRPDGSVFATSEFDVERGGEWFLLRDDGTLKAKYHCKHSSDEFGQVYVADGPAVFYNPDGSIERRAIFRAGQEAPP